MRYLLLLCFVLAGCGMPETARAAKQAEQAVDGMSIILEDSVPVINKIEDEETRKRLQEGLKKLVVLIQSAKLSLQPALAYLGDGKDIKVDTTPKEAAQDPQMFATKAALQSGRAAVEVEDRLTWTDMFLSFVDPSALEGWLVGISTLLFGTGTVGVVAAKVIKTISLHKNAAEDAIRYAKKAQKIDPKDEDAIDKLKEEEAKIQQSRGTKAIIDSALTRIKTHGTHT